jgi:Tfp pilus assembly protein PilO
MVSGNRNWIFGAAIVAVIVVVAGWFLGIQPQLSTAAIATSDTADLNAANGIAQVELTRLKAQDAALPKLTKELDALQKTVPGRALLEEYTKQLVDLAVVNAVGIVSINFSVGTPFTPTESYAKLVPPSITASNLVVIPFTSSLVGTRDALNAYIDAIQKNPRISIIQSFILAQGADPATWGLDITGAVFVLIGPDGSQEAIPPTPTPTPTPTGTPTPTTTPSPTPTG